MQPDYESSYQLRMNVLDKVAFRIGVSICNVKSYDDTTKTASEWFLTWDILEDAMPFLTHPPIYVDIRWTENDLKKKVQELGLERRQIVILINSSQLKGVPRDSATLGCRMGHCPSGISSLLNPTRVVMDASLLDVQEVGHGFLRGCSSLKEVDLSGLRNVQKMGDSFLYGCSSLQEVNLSPLCNIQKVGNNFLNRCSSLKEVELSPLSKVQKVGGGFLSGCSSLKEANLSPLSKVQKVGYSFLSGCSSLKEVNLSPLCNVQVVGSSFLYGCSSLTRIILPESPPEAFRRAVQELPVCMQKWE